jgi:hypothetical protein
MDPDGYELLMGVLRKRHMSEMGEFPKAVLEYRGIKEDAQRRAAAENIWETYLRQGARRQCNIPGVDIRAIEEKMNQGATSDLFDPAYREMVKLLISNRAFQEVQKMPEYAQLVTQRQEEQKQKSKRGLFGWFAKKGTQ